MADNQEEHDLEEEVNPQDPLDEVNEEEEIVEEEVVEDGGILYNSQASQSSALSSLPNVVFPQTMQIQREVFVLTGDHITPEDAEAFYEQACRLPHLRVEECMNRQAIALVHVKNMTCQSPSALQMSV
jgi:hypothetical protein